MLRCKICNTDKEESEFYYFKSKKAFVLTCKQCHRDLRVTSIKPVTEPKTCLNCGEMFPSKNKYNRLCAECNEIGDWP